MTREEQKNEYISTFIEQYTESVDCHPKEVEHIGNFIRIGINWADRHPKDEVNWQQVRIQASIAAMQGFCANPNYFELNSGATIPEAAIVYSDDLIEKLKGK